VPLKDAISYEMAFTANNSAILETVIDLYKADHLRGVFFRISVTLYINSNDGK
jgi:hypothetical protein